MSRYMLVTEGVEFTIPAENIEAALVALQASGLTSILCACSPNARRVLGLAPANEATGTPAEALRQALDDIGFDIEDSPEFENVYIERYCGDSSCQDEVVIALAPYVADGSYIEWRGEDGERWRDEVRGGRVFSQGPVVTWVDDNEKGAAPRPFITLIPVQYRDAANHKAQGLIKLDGLITPTQVAALKTALNDGVHYVPAQLGLTHFGGGAWSSFPCEDDHGWHEMLLDDLRIVTAEAAHVGPWNGNSDPGGAVTEFVQLVQHAAASGWNPSEGSHSC